MKEKKIKEEFVDCPFCHTKTMKLVEVEKDGKMYKCTTCYILMKISK